MLWEPPDSAVFHVPEPRDYSTFRGRDPLTACHQAGERDIDDLGSHVRHLGGETIKWPIRYGFGRGGGGLQKEKQLSAIQRIQRTST